MTLGEKIQKCRKNGKMSQEGLASRLGVSRQAVSKWELNESVPDTENVIRLERIFQVSVDYLLKNEIEEDEVKVEINRDDDIVKRSKLHVGWGIYVVAAVLFLVWSYQRNMIGTGIIWVIDLSVLSGMGYVTFLIVKALRKYNQK